MFWTYVWTREEVIINKILTNVPLFLTTRILYHTLCSILLVHTFYIYLFTETKFDITWKTAIHKNSPLLPLNWQIILTQCKVYTWDEKLYACEEGRAYLRICLAFIDEPEKQLFTKKKVLKWANKNVGILIFLQCCKFTVVTAAPHHGILHAVQYKWQPDSVLFCPYYFSIG